MIQRMCWLEGMIRISRCAGSAITTKFQYIITHECNDIYFLALRERLTDLVVRLRLVFLVDLRAERRAVVLRDISASKTPGK